MTYPFLWFWKLEEGGGIEERGLSVQNHVQTLYHLQNTVQTVLIRVYAEDCVVQISKIVHAVLHLGLNKYAKWGFFARVGKIQIPEITAIMENGSH